MTNNKSDNSFDINEKEKEVTRIIKSLVTGIKSEINAHLIPQKDGTFYVNVFISISNDRDDAKSNETQIAIMKWGEALINMFRLELGLEVKGVVVS